MIHDQNPPGGARPGTAPAETARQLKLQILQERMRLSETEAGELLVQLKADAAKQLGIPPSTIEVDIEFAGRELDFTITADMQNLPPSRSRSS